jgi:dTDP-4-amino-4,6-dideoxygalactose transaminase
VFADVRPDTLNLDERRVASLITSRTRAIVAVHYAGVSCEMMPLTRVAAAAGASLVEDNAHGLFGRYCGRPLGTLGRLAALSFHETKNVTCGEGGALAINDPQLLERAEILREKGTNRTAFFRGETNQYTWIDVGSSYLPSEILAAFLCAQLESRERVQAARRDLWGHYVDGLSEWAARTGVGMPCVPGHCRQPFHMFYLLLPSARARAQLRAHLLRHGIESVSHYVPLHLSPMGRRFGGDRSDCPVTEDISARLLRLPFHASLGEHGARSVVETITAWDPSG